MKNKLCLAVKHSIAFTLAETLIVIGVIGIVSALTLPNLNSSTGEKEKVAKVQKIYQNISDAFGRAEAVYGPHGEWLKSTDIGSEKEAKRFGERIVEFMKVSKDCGTLVGGGCAKSGKFKEINGRNDWGEIDSKAFYKIISSDGSTIGISANSFFIDIDGPNKGPFVLGKDVFLFGIKDSGVTPTGIDKSFNEIIKNCYEEGNYAVAWIIKYGNMDYLQLKDKNGTCKNGNVMTEANPRCK